MGRKKVKRTQVKTKKGVRPMEKRFPCPRCNQDQVVQCKIVKSSKKGYASCTVCDAKYVTRTNHLTAPIDIYSEWIDHYSTP